MPRCSRPLWGLDFVFALAAQWRSRLCSDHRLEDLGSMPHSLASSSEFKFSGFKFSGFKFGMIGPITVALLASCAFVTAQTKAVNTVSSAAVVERGKSVFGQNCAFCHGREGFRRRKRTEPDGFRPGHERRTGQQDRPGRAQWTPGKGHAGIQSFCCRRSRHSPRSFTRRRKRLNRIPAAAAAYRWLIFKPAMSRLANSISMVREPARPAIPPLATWPALPVVIRAWSLKSECSIRVTPRRRSRSQRRPDRRCPASSRIRTSSPSG